MGIFDGLAGVGINAASGNYAGAALSGVGLAVSLFGGASQSSLAKDAYNIQSHISGLEGQVNDQREEAMQLSARRQSMEIIRNTQRMRALGLNNATNQGASYGNSSGLQGGLAQMNAQGSFNLQGVNQNLEIGENIFGLNRNISKDKLALSGVQTQMSTAQGISAMGGSITKAADPISRMMQQWGAGGPITLGGPGGPTPFS